MDAFPEDWKYYTLNYPVARYKHLSLDQIIEEMNQCNGTFYSISNILERLGRNLLAGRNPLFSLVSNLTSRRISMLFTQVYAALWQTGELTEDSFLLARPRMDLVDTWEAGVEQLRRLAAAVKLQVAGLFRQP